MITAVRVDMKLYRSVRGPFNRRAHLSRGPEVTIASSA